jgi:hypothetical protein
MSSSATATRPTGVTLVAVLAIISGVIETIFGLVFLVNADNVLESLVRTGHTTGELQTIGVVTLALGIVTLLLAWGLLRGSNVARIIVGIVAMMRLISAGLGLFLLWGAWSYWWSALFTGIVAFLIIYLLFFEEEAVRWFAKND